MFFYEIFPVFLTGSKMVELGLPLSNLQSDDFWLSESFRDPSIADAYIIGEVIGR